MFAVNMSPPSFELSKPLPAILSPFLAMASPPRYRSRAAYTAHWPVALSYAGSSWSVMPQFAIFW